jgi:hypothetical protein
MGLSLAAALAVCTSAGQAQQPKAGNPATPPKVRTVNYQAEKPVQPTLPTPKPVAPAMELGSAKPVPGINATGMACAPNGAKSNVGFCCRLWRWLTFRPVTHHSILCCKETSCTPPLYAYFLEHCPPGSAGGHAQPCANGQCIARMTRPEARVADAPKVVSRPMTERAAAKPSAPAQRPVVREEVQAVVRKVSGEAKPARDETCLEGKECGKWRMLPTKMSDLGRR